MRSHLAFCQIHELEAHIDLGNWQDQILIVDGAVRQLYEGQLGGLLSHLPWRLIVELTGTEELKSLAQYAFYAEKILASRPHRGTLVVVVGGGSVTDFGGFLAATLLRGLSWIAIPTTLLGMIDASIGGKVAINAAGGKNLLGSFHCPDQVYICKDFLRSFSLEELQAGSGELVKYALLSSKIAQLITSGASIAELVAPCALFKERVVSADPKERKTSAQGRIILNLGHTFAHALESLYGISHSSAVYTGLVWEGVFCQDAGDQPKRAQQMARLLGMPECYTPASLAQKTGISWQPCAFLDACLLDKKRSQAEEWVLIISPRVDETELRVFTQQRSEELMADFPERLRVSLLDGVP